MAEQAVELAVVRAGDVLVLTTPRDISAEKAQEIKDKIRERLPQLSEGDIVLVTNMSGVAVLRGGVHG